MAGSTCINKEAMPIDNAPKWGKARVLYLALGIVICAVGVYLIFGSR